MFRRKTVIVTGAGASWHYGYPTGEELVRQVILSTRRVRSYLAARLKNLQYLEQMPQLVRAHDKGADKRDLGSPWANAIHECEVLDGRLQSTAPLVIDYFLGWNKSLETLGKAMIAFALLEREAFGAGKENTNLHTSVSPIDVSDKWMRFVVHQLLMQCADNSEFAKGNNVDFVTFNYDRSLESNLTDALSSVDFLHSDDVRAFMKPERVLHMYGALEPEKLSPTREHFQRFDQGDLRAGDLLDVCIRVAKNLRVIDPHTKDLGPEGQIACDLLDEAEQVYFLGFGFDTNNLRRLGFPSPHRRAQKIFFTNFGNSMAVNKRAAAAFELAEFKKPETWYGYNVRASVEKSSRNCYAAIALDFGAFDAV